MTKTNPKNSERAMNDAEYKSPLTEDKETRTDEREKKSGTPLELMLARAETAELALRDSNKSLASLQMIQKNNYAAAKATNEIVENMQLIISENGKDAAQQQTALEDLRTIIEKNRVSMERGALEYSEVHDMAFIDALTGLPNRRLLDDRLSQIILNNKRWNSFSAAIFVDIDKFKAVNDTHGHDAGDELLIAVGSRLKACIRESDTVARYGGDEFVVLLDHLDGNLEASQHQAHTIASKMLTSLTLPYTLHIREGKKIIKSIEYQSFASFGIAMFDGVVSDKAGILDRADKAMYQAKSEGGKTIRFAVLPEKASKPL